MWGFFFKRNNTNKERHVAYNGFSDSGIVMKCVFGLDNKMKHFLSS